MRFYLPGKFEYPILKNCWPLNLQIEQPAQVEEMEAESQVDGRGPVPNI